MPSGAEDLEFDDEQEEILHALHFAVGNICRRVEQEEDGNDYDDDDDDAGGGGCGYDHRNKQLKMSKSSIRTLTQMTYHYATKCLAKDLSAFSKHANRKTITVDDVKLVARKNPRGLMDAIEGFCEHASESNIRERKRNKVHVVSNKRPLENKSIYGIGTEDASISGESSTDNLLQGGTIWRKQGSSTGSSQQLQMEWNIRDISSSSSSSSSSNSCSDGFTGNKGAQQEGNARERKHVFGGDISKKNSKQDPSELAIDLVDSESE